MVVSGGRIIADFFLFCKKKRYFSILSKSFWYFFYKIYIYICIFFKYASSFSNQHLSVPYCQTLNERPRTLPGSSLPPTLTHIIPWNYSPHSAQCGYHAVSHGLYSPFSPSDLYGSSATPSLDSSWKLQRYPQIFSPSPAHPVVGQALPILFPSGPWLRILFSFPVVTVLSAVWPSCGLTPITSLCLHPSLIFIILKLKHNYSIPLP